MRILKDENVPTWVPNVFSEHGHEVLHVETLLMKGTADEVVAIVGNDMNAIVLTRNWRHFKGYTSRRLPSGVQGKFRKLSVIEIDVDPRHEEERIREEFELIEFEYARRITMKDTRINVAIKRHQIVMRR